MKRAVIVHCWDGYPDYCWYPKTKQELEEKGFAVSVPAMPETGTPKLSLWLTVLQQTANPPTKDLYLIGHSVGCITILRYLETVKKNERVGGVILVAGFTDDLGYKELSNFFQTPIDFKKIKERVTQVVAIHSDNDPYVALKYADISKKELHAKVIAKHNYKHFSGPVDKEESCTSLPEVSREIFAMNG